ncbi:MAG: TIGR02808 family protein [Gammaproteobacteria bacterium]|nr:MAG: TIGR02808 family protein [Gammaproteobacteria bacterium]
MGGIEDTIWNMLGYFSMPLIFIIGYLATAYVSCFLLNVFSKNDQSLSTAGATSKAPDLKYHHNYLKHHHQTKIHTITVTD